MPGITPSEAALLNEVRQLRARIASLEAERQVPIEIIEKAPVMISIVRAPDFIYELVNPAFQAFAPGKEFLGRRFADVWAEVSDPLVETLQNVIATGRTFHLEQAPYTIDRGRGMPPEVVYVSYSWIPLSGPDGKPDRVLTLAHEVTGAVRQRRQIAESKQAFQKSEEQFRVLTENLQSAVALIDEHGSFSIVNSSFRRIFDIPPDADILNINSRDWSEWQVFGEDGSLLDVDEHPVRRAALSCTPVKNQLVAVKSPSNPDLRWLLISAEPILDAQGKMQRLICTYYDITERKRTEERLRQAQKLESIGLLAGGIAHDFNNLLTGVMGNASLLLEDASPEQAETLRSVIAGTERAAHLTRQLLAYSGKGQFIVRELDVTQAVSEMADLVQFSIPKSVGLSLNLDRRLPPVAMDPGQLQQILMNLVINAGEAIGEGKPGRITVTTSMADVEAPFTDELGEEISPGRYVRVDVHDTGSGIDPEKKPKIFEPFFTTKFVGRGLGLAAIAGILRSQKGGIVVESQPGMGSTFRVFLPSAGRTGVVVQGPGSQDGRPVILVIDDEASVRDFISAVLRRKGYHVFEASDGQEALAACASAPAAIDAAIVDIVMPNMSANDLLPALKAKQPGIRLLLTSGYSEAEARRLCAAYPGAAFIQKPYTAQQLAIVIDDLVGADWAT